VTCFCRSMATLRSTKNAEGNDRLDENPPEVKMDTPENDSGNAGWVDRWTAMRIIGISERQLYRLVDAGRLRYRREPRPGRRPAVTYCLEDVNALRDERRATEASAARYVPFRATLNDTGNETAENAAYFHIVIGQLYLQVRDLEETLSRRHAGQDINVPPPEHPISSSPSE
jgi:hypothetical protein